MRIVGMLREKREETREVWIDERVRVERSPPSPSESQFAPTAKIMRSALEAKSTACYEEKLVNEVKGKGGRGNLPSGMNPPDPLNSKKAAPQPFNKHHLKNWRSKLNLNWCVRLKNTLNVSEYFHNDYPSMSN
jgi:hypothetical protein